MPEGEFSRIKEAAALTETERRPKTDYLPDIDSQDWMDRVVPGMIADQEDIVRVKGLVELYKQGSFAQVTRVKADYNNERYNRARQLNAQTSTSAIENVAHRVFWDRRVARLKQEFQAPLKNELHGYASAYRIFVNGLSQQEVRDSIAFLNKQRGIWQNERQRLEQKQTSGVSLGSEELAIEELIPKRFHQIDEEIAMFRALESTPKYFDLAKQLVGEYDKNRMEDIRSKIEALLTATEKTH